MLTSTRAGLERLKERFAGSLIIPSHAGYEEARRVWNATADRRPALVARCATPADVAAALQFARDQDLIVAVRGGGHSYPGFSTCDDGVVVDLGQMQQVAVDPERRVATVQGGALLEGLDTAAQRHGLVCPVGAVSHTGVAGLTLGGGLGRLMRRFGLTIDNVIDVELVSSEGRRIRASDDEYPELFWGLRGAGANFGVATSFRFRLHPAGPDVVAGAAAWPIERAHEVGAMFREWSISAPDDLTASYSVFEAGDDFGPDLAGRPIVMIAAAHPGRRSRRGPRSRTDQGPWARLRRVRADPVPRHADSQRQLLRLGQPQLLEGRAPHQSSGRHHRHPGVVNRLDAAPSALCGFGIMTMGGAVARTPDDATAFSGRQANFPGLDGAGSPNRSCSERKHTPVAVGP